MHRKPTEHGSEVKDGNEIELQEKWGLERRIDQVLKRNAQILEKIFPTIPDQSLQKIDQDFKEIFPGVTFSKDAKLLAESINNGVSEAAAQKLYFENIRLAESALIELSVFQKLQKNSQAKTPERKQFIRPK